MSSSLVIRATAVKNVNDAYWWYEEKRTDLGEEFLREMNLAYQQIIDHPGSYKFIFEDFRQYVLKKFPYVIVYKVYGSTIVVFNVIHTSRDFMLRIE